ncbi:MAG: J domain-containing protein [Desulfobulbaceae bacterium]|nr:MAG: J domain-containing protein [Desulfobulbaceae bacterium]
MVTKRQWARIEEAKELFGLADRATLAEIKAAFRRFSKRYHPDLAGESAANRAKIQQGTEAYQALLAFCEAYEFPLVIDESDLEPDDEDWWMDRFGQDPLWGPARDKG